MCVQKVQIFLKKVEFGQIVIKSYYNVEKQGRLCSWIKTKKKESYKEWIVRESYKEKLRKITTLYTIKKQFQ